MLAVLRELEHKYSREVVIIGVHSAKFLAEKAEANLRYATRRLQVDHPVVSDKDFKIWHEYVVRAWPTLIFIDPQGRIVGKHEGEAPLAALDGLVADLVQSYESEGTLSREPLSLKPELDEAKAGTLYFPGKILADKHSGRLIIADTGHHRMIVAGVDGKVWDIAGGGEPGLKDGDFTTSRFDSPQGMALRGDILFLADTGNHVIRRLDLELRTVDTIAGTGIQSISRVNEGPARDIALSSPWDLALQGEYLFIAMAGLHQIWLMDLQTHTVSVFAGAGPEGVRDGPREAAWFAQPSGLAREPEDDLLYVADSEASAIRWIDLGPRGGVHTLVGLGLFEFGDVDGAGASVRLQHALGVAASEGVLYIADTYNNKIKRAMPGTREVATFAGDGRPGARDGSAGDASFNEPGGLSATGGLLYVADTNNHVIRVIDLASRDVRTLEIAE